MKNILLQKNYLNIHELNLLELNFDGMKKLLNSSPNQTRIEEMTKEKHEKMVKELMKEDFEELMKFTEPPVSEKYIFYHRNIFKLSSTGEKYSEQYCPNI